MKHRKQTKQQETLERSTKPGNLLDLNRALPNYSYHPGVESMHIPPEPPKRRFSWKRFFKWSAISITVVVLLAGGWLGWKILHNELKVFGWKGLASIVHPTKLKGEDSGHVNILIAGNSADDPGHQGGSLTDSIMLVSLNTKTNTGFMLSIPRDLYVNIPGEGYAKINEAYQDGNNDGFSQAGYPSGGIGLLEKTVSQATGLPIQYYAVVNYGAVRDAVNAVGGITVNIKSSDSRGLNDPSPDWGNSGKPLVDHLTNGPHTLNGIQALGLSRSRGDTYGSYGYALSDFTRTQNQRLILLGLKDKASSLSTLSNPLKLSDLFDSLGNNVKTDLTLGGVARLYNLVKKVPNSKIASIGLNSVDNKNLLASHTTRSGQSALIPAAGIDDFSDIQAYLQTVYNPPAPAPSPTNKTQ
ncbi:MAG TPA: LCP family protein [Patescibacteria group bacterium]|nr:LCP family protein [Patescibacteria group bacterium]